MKEAASVERGAEQAKGASPLPPTTNGERPEGLSEEQWATYKSRERAKREGNSKPMPGPLLDAFMGFSTKAAGLEFQPVVHSQMVILQGLDSPFLRMLGMEEAERLTVPVRDEDIYELAFLFMRPVAECRAALRKGREFFREEACKAVGDRLPPQLLPEVASALGEHLNRAFGTLLEYEAATPGGDDGTVFTGRREALKTGSAGV